VPTGDNTSTFLGTKIQGGQPPDVAFLPQVGVLRQFAEKGWLKPVDSGVQAQLDKNFTKGWQELGAYQGKQYGVYAKAANKSLVWYNTASFETAGITEDPATWADFLTTAQTVYESGTPAVSVGGANGWTLTDWFENVYLSQAGPEKYDQLAEHKIKWTDPSVKAALTTLAELFGNKDLVAGGTSGARSRSPRPSPTRRRRRWSTRATSWARSSPPTPRPRWARTPRCSPSLRSAPARPRSSAAAMSRWH
jgi:multiple sugar transport system substrate-binding protein/alpha-glucoside transport system substrate-binding protein